MRTLIIALVLTLAGSSAALAALPPQYQRQAELIAIISHGGVVDAFGFGGIEAVEYVAADHYQVRGGGCVLEVTIADRPSEHEAGWVGPREFSVVVGEKTCAGGSN